MTRRRTSAAPPSRSSTPEGDHRQRHARPTTAASRPTGGGRDATRASANPSATNATTPATSTRASTAASEHPRHRPHQARPVRGSDDGPNTLIDQPRDATSRRRCRRRSRPPSGARHATRSWPAEAPHGQQPQLAPTVPGEQHSCRDEHDRAGDHPGQRHRRQVALTRRCTEIARAMTALSSLRSRPTALTGNADLQSSVAVAYPAAAPPHRSG